MRERLVVVDSSVWIDYFRNIPTRQVDALERLLTTERVIIGDLVLSEVLQGFTSNAAFDLARERFSFAVPLVISDEHVALQAAVHYRTLRAKGSTVRKLIDTLIATRCIIDDLPLLYSDRDFDPFVAHLGLRSVLDGSGVN